MESKYYTPELEEFHVGFEYEKRFSMVVETLEMRQENNFHPIVFKISDSLECIKQESEFTDIRVKLLNKEDIESLGCIQDTNNIYWYTYNNHVFNYSDITNWMNIWIKDTFNSPTRTAVFSGIVKNKSEFKKLIKQLDLDLTHRNKFETDWTKN